MDAPLRDGWRNTYNSTYYRWPAGDTFSTYGRVSEMPNGDGWGGVVFTSQGDDLTATSIPTLEEAMIWVETTYALLE
jgi:hypothetical protein